MMGTCIKDRGVYCFNESPTGQIWDDLNIKINTEFIDNMNLKVDNTSEPTNKLGLIKEFKNVTAYQINSLKTVFKNKRIMNNPKELNKNSYIYNNIQKNKRPTSIFNQ